PWTYNEPILVIARPLPLAAASSQSCFASAYLQWSYASLPCFLKASALWPLGGPCAHAETAHTTRARQVGETSALSTDARRNGRMRIAVERVRPQTRKQTDTGRYSPNFISNLMVFFCASSSLTSARRHRWNPGGSQSADVRGCEVPRCRH